MLSEISYNIIIRKPLRSSVTKTAYSRVLFIDCKIIASLNMLMVIMMIAPETSSKSPNLYNPSILPAESTVQQNMYGL